MIKNIEELSSALEKAHLKCLEPLNGPNVHDSPTLYHYTDASAALAILEKGSLRFTNIKYCNDPGEFENGLDIFNRISDEVFDYYFKESQPFMYLMNFIRYFLNLSTSFKHQEEKLLSDVKAAMEKFKFNSGEFEFEKSSIFVSCLSESSDDLRQWLPYGDNGQGIALGFKGMKDNLHDLIAEDSDIYIIKVCYEPMSKKEQYVRDIYASAYEVFKEMDPLLFKNFVHLVYESILYDIIASKSEHYKGEAEWRLILVQGNVACMDKLNFRVKDNIIRPYIEVAVKKDSILEIKLGPKTERVLNSHVLNILIQKFGYEKMKIKESEVSYR